MCVGKYLRARMKKGGGGEGFDVWVLEVKLNLKVKVR